MPQVLRIVLHEMLTCPKNRRPRPSRIRKIEDIKWQATALRYRCALQDGTLQGSW